MYKRLYYKQCICFFFLFFTLFQAYSQSYKITDVKYSITGNEISFLIGKTREHPLRQAVPIDTSSSFATKEQLISYVNNVKQLLQNQRVFASSNVEFVIGLLNTDTNTYPVTLHISTVDTWNLFPLPYPKYDSNEGFIFKLKVKDYNFLGSMHTLDFDLNYLYVQYPNQDKDDDHKFGINLGFEIPFKLWKLNSSTINNVGISYVVGSDMPEFDISSQISFSFPLPSTTINLGFVQKITQDNDYASTNDDLYLTEKAFLRLPFNVAQLGNWSTLVWAPYANIEWNWDFDIFSSDDVINSVTAGDLLGPKFSIGYTLSTGRVDWTGNFRKGLTISAEQYYTYNLNNKIILPVASIEMTGFTSNSFMGFYFRAHAFHSLNSTIEIGGRMRGIINNDYSSLGAFTFNFDFPIKVLKTDWTGWGWTKIKIFKFLRYLDFEMQMVPFLDISIGKNTETNTICNYKDGWYTAGVEAVIFPKKMRSIQGRVMFGYDLSKILPDTIINKEWRSTVYDYEFYFGIGLFY